MKGRNWFRLAFFSPQLVGQVFVGVLFMVLYVPQYGLVNRGIHAALTSFPLDTKWLGDARMVMPALVLIMNLTSVAIVLLPSPRVRFALFTSLTPRFRTYARGGRP